MRWLRFPWMLFVATLACAQAAPTSHCRCGRNGESTLLAQLAPTAPAVAMAPLPDGDPIQSVLALFAAFEARDPSGWVRVMARTYRFDSDDPSFVSAHPGAYGRDDELAFATHLFRGGGHGPDGRALPVVVQVEAPLGAVWVEMRSLAATRAVAHVERWGYMLTFDDGTQLSLAGTDNTLELALEDGEWRVVAWHERLHADAIAAATPSHEDEPSGSAADAIPARLAVRRLGGLGGEAIAFELALPHRGGRLELFDVQGRRVAQRSLDGLEPGVRRLELPASGVAAGTYWARVQQSGAVVTTRVIRL